MGLCKHSNVKIYDGRWHCMRCFVEFSPKDYSDEKQPAPATPYVEKVIVRMTDGTIYNLSTTKVLPDGN